MGSTATASPALVRSAELEFERIAASTSMRSPSWPVAVIAAFGLCALSLVISRGADLATMTDMGLASVLPPIYFVALGTLTITFTISLRRPDPPALLLAAHLVVLIVMLYGVAPLVEETTRTAIEWKLRGITDHILSTGGVDASIDAFFNWPGFFIVMGFFTQLAGLSNPADSFPAWSPVFFNLLYLLPLFMIMRTASANPRVPWLGVWFFCIANWIGQDYLSPQALNYFLFLVILAVLLKFFSPARGAGLGPLNVIAAAVPKRLMRYARFEAPAAASSPVQRVALMAIIVVVFASIAPSHQLTPVAAVALVSLLVLFNRITTRGLPVVMGLLAFAWISYGAVTYLEGHFQHVAGAVGAVSENVNANVTNRFRGSAEHHLIVSLRSGMSAFIWLLALVGAIRRARRGRPDATLAMLAAGPFLLLPLQAYGGELLLRVYLFSLPAMVFFGAAAFLTGTRSHKPLSPQVSVAVAVTSMVLIGGFLLARYGDERMHYMSKGEVAGIEHLYASTPANARYIALNRNVAWRYRDYESHKYVGADQKIPVVDAPGLTKLLSATDVPTYLVVTRSQLAFEEISNGKDSGDWDRLERELLATGSVAKLWSNGDTDIFAAKAPVVVQPSVESVARASTTPAPKRSVQRQRPATRSRTAQPPANVAPVVPRQPVNPVVPVTPPRTTTPPRAITPPPAAQPRQDRVAPATPARPRDTTPPPPPPPSGAFDDSG
jgi:hypothetical protein